MSLLVCAWGQPRVPFPSRVSPAATAGAQQTQSVGSLLAGTEPQSYRSPGLAWLWLHHGTCISYKALTQEEPFQSGYFGEECSQADKRISESLQV